MKNLEIEKVLDELILSKEPTPSIRELARRYGYHQNQFMRDYRSKVTVLIKKRKLENPIKKVSAKKWQMVFKCLKCDKEFASNGVFNRLCDGCKNRECWV